MTHPPSKDEVASEYTVACTVNLGGIGNHIFRPEFMGFNWPLEDDGFYAVVDPETGESVGISCEWGMVSTMLPFRLYLLKPLREFIERPRA